MGLAVTRPFFGVHIGQETQTQAESEERRRKFRENLAVFQVIRQKIFFATFANFIAYFAVMSF